MESITTLYKVIIFIVYGIVLGVITVPLSKYLAKSRTEDPGEIAPLNKTSIRVLSVILGLLASAGIAFTSKDLSLLIRNLILLIPIFSISFVDALVRKIPNPLLLTMLCVDAVYITYYSVANKTAELLPKVFIGVFLGMVVSFIPSLLKIPMGAGDIKYTAVIGFTIYASGYFQAMILMALLVALFYVYLKITKKGGMKTQVPMGPFLSIGVVVTMCFPLLESYNTFF